MMYDKSLDSFLDEVVRVLYSADKTKRYVVLKKREGLFTYILETIYPFDEDEWLNFPHDKDALPAMWVPFGETGLSLFANEEDLLKDLQAYPEYKQYFE